MTGRQRLRRVWRWLLAAVGTVLVFLTGLCTAAVQTVDTPRYIASALIETDTPGELADVNVIVWPDRVEVEEPEYNDDGHAKTADWRGTLPGVPEWAIPVAPLMGWNVTFMGAVARKERPLYYCMAERRTYDAQRGTNTAAIGERAIRDGFDALFDILPSVEDCNRADLVGGANATQDCGSAQAYGCAALRFVAGRPVVRVTFDGNRYASGQINAETVYWIDRHEYGHAGDLGHVSGYAGQPAHDHCSNTGWLVNNRPADNQTGDLTCEEDWDDGRASHTNRWGLRLRGANPAPTSTPTATATLPPVDAHIPQYPCRVGQQWRDLTAAERDMLDRINAYRQSRGLGAAVLHQPLQDAASWFSADAVTRDLTAWQQDGRAHVDRLGRDPQLRTRDCGGRGGDITAYGSADPAAILAAWQGSPAHNAALLGPYTAVGVALDESPAFGAFWTVTLGYTDSQPTPTPTATPQPTATPTPQMTATPTPAPSSCVDFVWQRVGSGWQAVGTAPVPCGPSGANVCHVLTEAGQWKAQACWQVGAAAATAEAPAVGSVPGLVAPMEEP